MSAIDPTTDMPVGGWFGRFDGTINGNLFMEVRSVGEDTDVTISARSEDTVVAFEGRCQRMPDDSVAIRVTSSNSPSQETAEGLFLIRIIRPHSLSGNWKLRGGDQGVFTLSPANLPAPPAPPQPSPPRQSQELLQIVQRTETLPKLRLFRDDIQQLSAKMKELLPTPFEVIVQATTLKDKDVRRPFSAFWQVPDLPAHTDSIALSLTEPGPGLLRSINITLSPETSTLTVLGPDDVWVSGAFSELKSSVGRHYSRWRLPYERYGLNLNGLALLLVIAFLPSLQLAQRFFFLTISIALILGVKIIHDFTTAVRVSLKKDRRERRLLELPGLVTGLATTVAGGLLTWLFQRLNDGAMRQWLEWVVGQT